MIFFPVLTRRSTVIGILAGLSLFASCKPSSTPGASPAVPPQGAAARQPDLAGMRTYCQTLLPSGVRLTDLKTDAPTQAPNMPPGTEVWLVNAKLTLTPAEDLLALPPADDAHAIDALVGELSTLVAWRNAYVRSPYARTYGAYDVPVPTAPLPQLLVVTQAKDTPLPPIYGQLACQWQVDRWRYDTVDLNLPTLGKPRAAFVGSSTMVKGSPEAEKILTAERKAISEAKDKQAAIENHYAQDLRAATQPGTVYKGQVSYSRGVLSCEVHFLPASGADPLTAMFEVKLPQDGAYQYVYTAKLASKIPLPLPADDASSTGSFRLAQDAPDPNVPIGNLTVNFAHGTGKAAFAGSGSLPALMLSGAQGLSSDTPFLLLNGHLQGVAASFNGHFSLSADLTTR